MVPIQVTSLQHVVVLRHYITVFQGFNHLALSKIKFNSTVESKQKSGILFQMCN